MAKKPDISIDVFPWLQERGLITDVNDADQRKTGILWLKRNLVEVTLLSPKRGCYRANEDELNSAYAQHLTTKKEISAKKAEQAKILNARNKVIANENKRRLQEGQSAMTPEERSDFLKQQHTIDMVNSLLNPKGNGSADKPKKRTPIRPIAS